MRHKILIIDDDTSLAEILALHFEDAGYLVDVCNSLKEAEDKTLNDYNMALLDHHLTDGLGLQFLKDIKSDGLTCPVIMMTGKHDMDLAIEALRLGALDYVHKPIDMKSLDRLISAHIQSQNIHSDDNIIPLPQVDAPAPAKLIGSHPLMLDAIKKIALASNNMSSVLLHGEIGTGKTLASKIIYHYFSQKGPFTFIQAGSALHIPDQAQFLVLNHIEKLTAERADALHTWLVQHENTPVKVISTSTQNLQELKKTLPKNLLVRLSDMQVYLPAIHEHMSDIEDITVQLCAHIKETLNSPITGLHKNIIPLLQSNPWPQNIADLQTVLSTAMQNTQGHILEKDNVQQALHALHSPQEHTNANQVTQATNLQNIEEQTILNALILHQGHKSKTAQSLGISRPALDRKITKYKFDIQNIKKGRS